MGSLAHAEPLEPRQLFAVTDLGVEVSDLDRVVTLDGVAYFPGCTGGADTELWRSDGTAAGTRLVKDLIPGPQGSFPYALTIAGGALYFAASVNWVGAGGGVGVWRSDGTAAGTTLLRTFETVYEIVDFNGVAHFVARETAGGTSQIYRTDGTPGGTVAVTALGGTDAPSVSGLAPFGNRLLFIGGTGAAGWEPWITDDTPAGAHLLKDVYPGRDNGYPIDFPVVGGKAYFFARDPVVGEELWTTDGTAAGTHVVRDLLPGAAGSGLTVRYVSPDRAWAICQTQSYDLKTELWRLDGAAGTLTKLGVVSDDGNSPTGYTYLDLGNGTVLFTGHSASTGEELWRTDGTAAGTTAGPVRDAGPGPGDGIHQEHQSLPAAVADGVAYYAGPDGAGGWTVWRTDGTAAGTYDAAAALGGATGADPQHFTLLPGGRLLYTAAVSTYVHHLRVADLPPADPPFVAGTVFNDADADGVRDANEAGVAGRVVFLDADGDGLRGAAEPWATTDARGDYRIANPPAGAYVARQELPAGWGQTAPAAGAGRAVTVGAANRLGVDFGAKPIPAQTPYLGTPFKVSGAAAVTVQAEHYDKGGAGVAFKDATAANTGGAAFRTGEGVDLKVVSGTNYAIASATAGEWAEYTVDVAAAGTYKLEVRAAAAAAGGKVHAELRDPATDAVAAALGGSIAVPNTGSTSTFATVSKTAALPAGRYVLRLAIDANATNGVAGVFDWLKLSAVPVTVKSTAAAYVRGGTSAGANFGAATDLSVRKAATAADTRETYIKFDLAAAGVAALTSAKLRLYGRLSDTSVGSLATTVYSAADTAWGESTITWNNKPAAGTTSRGTVTVGGTAAKWYELDLTAFLKAELAAGRGVVTLVLRNGATSTAQSLFAGDEQANGPQLVVVR